MNLLRIRKSLGFSQAELAKEVGVSCTTIGRIERYKIKPSPTIVCKIKQICEKYGVEFVEEGESFAAWHLSAMYELKY